MKIESTTALAVSLNTQNNETSQAGAPQAGVAATPTTGFADSSRFETGSAGIWAGPDGGGCVRLPPNHLPFPRLPPEPMPLPFPRPIPIPPPFPGKVTLSQGDRETARGLKDALSNPQWIGKHGRVTLQRDPSGHVVGPEGQPLAEVKLGNGRTAYVDPNTNQYYLANNKGGILGGLGLGGVSATGPIDLPPEAQFSNSHFSDADVRAIEKLANRPVEPGVTLKESDRKVARGWSDSLSGHGRLLDSKAPDAHLTRGPDGIMRGPEGEPLVEVKLKDGNTAYVDPNTNQYYLQGQRFGCFGKYSVTKGPFTLPPGAQVSNSHFSDADVRALQREANPLRIVWPPIPILY